MRCKVSHYLRISLAVLGLVLLHHNASAAYPDRPIRFILPYAPGGAGDLTARIFAQQLTQVTGASVVILNRPGAGFVNSTMSVVNAKPDGYTILLIGNGVVVATQLFKSLPYKMSDLKDVSTIAFFDLVVLVNPNSQFKSISDLIAYAKANPGKLNIGTIAVGSTQNLAADLFTSTAHVKMQVVPYSSTSEVLTALLGNQVQVAFEIVPSVIGQISSKALTALAVTSAKRFPGLPNVPTLEESGLKGYDVTSWNGIAVPAGTPDAVVQALAKASATALASPAVIKKMLSIGAVARASTPEQETARVQSDSQRYKNIIATAGIPLQ